MKSLAIFSFAGRTPVRRHRNAIILALILSIAIIVRLYKLGEIPAGLDWDEISAVYTPFLHQIGVVEIPIRGVLSYLLTGTYFIYSLFGPSNFLTRIPEVFFGILLVLAVWKLGKEMFSNRIGLLSSLFIAILPWAIHFSRFQAFSSAYALLVVITTLLIYRGIIHTDRKRVVYFCLAGLSGGLTTMIFASATIFVPLFFVIFPILYFKTRNGPFTTRGIVFMIIIFSCLYLINFLDFKSHDQISSRAVAYSTYSHSQNVLQWLSMVSERIRMHLSPAFLIFTIPSGHDQPFQETISRSSQIRYSPTSVGELGYYGIFVYPGILLLAYRGFVDKKKPYIIMLWWIISYCLVSGIAYFDNPNPARNIAGLPAFAITISLFIEYLVVRLPQKVPRRQVMMVNKVTIFMIVALVVISSLTFMNEYFTTYYEKSSRIFDYGYRGAADFLTKNNLWNNNIIVNDAWGRNLTLSFYSPFQPPRHSIAQIDDARNLNPVGQLASITKPTVFHSGKIQYEVKFEAAFGGGSASYFNMSASDGETFQFYLYCNDSSYAPNSYLVIQDSANNEGRFIDELKLPSDILKSVWHSVTLSFDDSNIRIELDGRTISVLARHGNSTYNSLTLGAESSNIAMKNIGVISIEKPDLSLQDSNETWNRSSGQVVIDQENTIKLSLLSNNSIIITHYPLEVLQGLNAKVVLSLLKVIDYPDKEVKLYILKLTI